MRKPTNKSAVIGLEGELLVQNWLIDQGHEILDQRWRSPHGEIDIIARNGDLLLFVEVKTRQLNNLDYHGLLTINHHKQTKIINTANYYLYTYPHLSSLDCRFDVAIVLYPQSLGSSLYSANITSDRTLHLHTYLMGAFP